MSLPKYLIIFVTPFLFSTAVFAQLLGDFDGDGVITVADVDMLSIQIQIGSTQLQYDLNGDGNVDLSDHSFWVHMIAQVPIGDVNLDGEFNTADLVKLQGSGKFQTGIAATWNEGDWNGDLVFNELDLVIAINGGGWGGSGSLFLPELVANFSGEPQLTVFNGNDSGVGSLRQVVFDAPYGRTITFDDTLDGQTILLTSGQILIDKNLGIDASSLPCGIIIDGNASGRIFETAASSTVFFESLTLTNGLVDDTGGAIYVGNSCNLTLYHSTLSGNFAENSRRGGGDGGGIYNGGTLTVNNSTLSGNSADGSLFGLDGKGGGIYNDGTLTLNNSTFSGNSAKRIGGGIHNASGDLTLNNSIVAGNSSSSGSPNIFGAITGSNNLTSGDPLLAPLGDYGGPTQTMPPLTDSPAIDMGGATTLTRDQRGLPRIVGGGLDIGAYETGNAAGYVAWAVETLPPGGDHSFGGDADADAIPNGVAYGVGPDGLPKTRLIPSGTSVEFGYRLEAEIDLIWILQRTTDLQSYEEILRIQSGEVTMSPNVTLSGGPPEYVVHDETSLPNVFYRLGVERVEPAL